MTTPATELNFDKVNKATETAPPKKARATKPRPPTGFKFTDDEIHEAILSLLGAGAMVFAMRGDEVCSASLLSNGERVADAWLKLAQKNKPARKMIETMLTGSTWAEVVFATGMMLLPIAEHHGLNIMGLTDLVNFATVAPMGEPEEVASGA